MKWLSGAKSDQITTGTNEISAETKRGRIVVPLDQILRIEIFKIDELTTDLICVEIWTRDRTDAPSLFLHEEMAGFDDGMKLLANLPGFDTDLFGKVCQPPFETCRTVVFERP